MKTPGSPTDSPAHHFQEPGSHQRIHYDSRLPSWLNFSHFQYYGTDSPQKREAPLGPISAMGPAGSHRRMLRWLCPDAVVPHHIPDTGSGPSCDVVRSFLSGARSRPRAAPQTFQPQC